ncbi:MAG: hypothetical protein V4530_03100 [Pseudomonadota bacterium]
MDRNAESRAVARAALADKVDMLARELPRLSPVRIAYAVDDIRREACGYRMDTIAVLASRLEREMAGAVGVAAALPYLEAMGDALDCDDLAPARQAALLASVSLRLHG